jgi:hypothetical protein
VDDYDDEERPTLAVVLSLLGAALMIVEGIYLASVASVVGSLGYGEAAGLIGGLGFLGLLLGFIVLILAILLWRDPDAHVGYGIAILVFSVVSILGGGGFYIGLVLGLIGGVLAIVFEPSEEYILDNPTTRAGVAQFRTCSMCEARISPGEIYCPNCGRPAT